MLVEWPFGPIAAGEQVEVEVRVTGNDGGTTDWSAPLALVGGFVDGPWEAEAIGLPAPAGEEQRLGQPGQLRYEFTVGEGLAKATLFATAHGVYQAEINGTEVDDQILKPGWTAYADRLNHETTDVTALLAPGANAIGVWLAGGWFTEKYGFHGFAKPFYGEQPAVKVELRLEYTDGTRETVASGPAWRAFTGGPLVSSGIYAGEAFDARRAEAGWSKPGFDDAHWLPAPVTNGDWAEATPGHRPAGAPHRGTARQGCPDHTLRRHGAGLRPEPGGPPPDPGHRRGRPHHHPPACRSPRGRRTVPPPAAPGGRHRHLHPRRQRYRGSRRGGMGTAVHVPRLPLCPGGQLARRAGPGGDHRRRDPQRHAPHRLVRVLRPAAEPAARKRPLGDARQLPGPAHRLPAA